MAHQAPLQQVVPGTYNFDVRHPPYHPNLFRSPFSSPEHNISIRADGMLERHRLIWQRLCGRISEAFRARKIEILEQEKERFDYLHARNLAAISLRWVMAFL